jgi:hypothetical protein
MVNKRKITLSCKLFWGFAIFVDLDEINSNEEIVNIILQKLKIMLNRNNLLNLVDELNRMIIDQSFHIHDVTFKQILLSNSNDTIYVCSH